MSISTPSAQESAGTTESSTTNTVNTFVSAVTDALAECGATNDTVEAVKEAGTELVSEVVDLETRVDDNREAVNDTADVIEEERERSARERADIRSDVHKLRENTDSDDESGDITDGTPKVDTVNVPTQTPQTPLEEVTRLPEQMAESELTANASRARAVFRDVLDYTESVPKGRAIATPDLRRVLTALRDDGSACYKTVSRVVGFLTELGQDDVWTTERMRGDTVVVFSEEICRRRAAQQNATDGVVTTGTGAD